MNKFKQILMTAVWAWLLACRAGAVLPGAPTGLTASVGALGMDLGWSPVVASPAVTGYQVYRSASSFTSITVAGVAHLGAVGVTLFTDSLLVEEGVYYGITAQNSDGEGLLAGGVLSVPVAVAAFSVDPPSATTAYMQWAPSDTPGVSQYSVWASVNPAISNFFSVAPSVFSGVSNTVTLGTPNAVNYIYIAPNSVSGFGAVAGPIAIADPPTAVSASGTGYDNRVLVSWSPAQFSGITNYEVLKHTSLVSDPLVSASAVTFTPVANNLTVTAVEGDINWFWVIALDSLGNTVSVSEPVAAVASLAPAPPTFVFAEMESFTGLMHVSFSAGTDGETTFPVAGQVIEATSPAGTVSVVVDELATQAYLTLTCGVNYMIGVYAIDLAGSESAVVTATADLFCGPVAGAISHSFSNGRLTTNWLPASPAVDQYLIARATYSSWASIGDTGVTLAVNDSPLTLSHTAAAAGNPGETEYFRVYHRVTQSVSVDSVSSEMVSSLEPPTQLSAVAQGGQVTLSWMSALTAQNPSVTAYQVYLRDAASVSDTVKGQVPEPGTGAMAVTTVAGLLNGTTYYFSIAAAGGLTTGSKTAPVSANVGLQTPVISRFTQSLGGPLTLTWEAADTGEFPVSNYRLYRGASVPVAVQLTWTTQTQFVDLTPPAATQVYFLAVSDTADNASSLTPGAASILTVNPLATPAQPVLVTFSTRVGISWPAVISATAYDIYRQSQGVTTIVTVTGTDYIDTGLQNGVPHNYSIVARQVLAPNQSQLESAFSISNTAVPFLPPGVPSVLTYSSMVLGVTFSAGASIKVVLGPAPLGTYGNIIIYNLYGGVSNTALSLLTSTAGLSYLHTNLLADKTYVYYVTATDNKGNTGLPSSLVSLSTSFVSAQPPGIADVSGTKGNVSLSWSEAIGGQYAISNYLVYRSENGYAGLSGQLLTVTALTDFSDLTVVPPAVDRVFYDLFSIDASGVTSAASTVVEMNFNSVTYPTQVLGVTVTSGNTGIVVEWEFNPASENVTTYTVFNQSVTLSAVAQSTNMAAYVVALGTNVTITVQANNATAVSGPASVEYVYLHLPQPPGGLAVWDVAEGNGDNTDSIRLNWNAVGGDISEYDIYRATFSFNLASEAANIGTGIAGTTYRDSAVTAGMTYYYRVLSSDGIFDGVILSAEVSAEAVAVPGMMAAPGVTASSQGAALDVTWATPTGSVLNYAVFSDLAAFTTPPLANPITTSSTVLTTTITGLGLGTSYDVGVFALNESGRSSLVGSTSAMPIPPRPTSLAVAAGNTGVNTRVDLAWTAPVGSLVEYVIYRAANAVDIPASPVATYPTGNLLTNYSEISVPAGTWYYGIVARNIVDSLVSDIVPVGVTGAASSAPSNFIASSVEGGVKLTWDQAVSTDFVTGYRVYRSENPLATTATASLLTETVDVVSGCYIDLDPSLIPGFSYKYFISALNQAGEGVASSAMGAAGAVAPPSPPVGLTLLAGLGAETGQGPDDTRIEIRWATPLTPTAGFEIYRSSSPIALTEAAGGFASPIHIQTCLWGDPACFVANEYLATDRTVAQGMTYYFAITAFNSYGVPVGESLATVANAGIEAHRSAGAAVFTQQEAGVDRIDLSWNPPVDSGTAGGTVSYRLYRDHRAIGSSQVNFSNIADSFPKEGYPLDLSSTSYTDVTPVTGVINEYYLFSVDSKGRVSLVSTQSNALVPSQLNDFPALPFVEGLTVIPGDSRVRLQWLVDPVNKDNKYNVYRRLYGEEYGAPVLSGVGPATIAFSGLAPGVKVIHQEDDTVGVTNKFTYVYSIAAFTDAGEGFKSPEWTVIPFKPVGPGLATATAEVNTNNHVVLSWGGAQGQDSNGGYAMDSYKVYRSVNAGATYTLVHTEPHNPLVASYTFTDANITFGFAYVYRIVPVDAQGNEGLSYPLVFLTVPPPVNNVLIYRNSFNPALGQTVRLQFSMVQEGPAWMKIYTLQGSYVATIAEVDVPAGTSKIRPWLSPSFLWDGTNDKGRIVASGVYLVHVEAPGYSANGKIAVIK